MDDLSAEGPLRISCSNVKLQQVEAKLKILSDIDKDILSKCTIDDIEREINESEITNSGTVQCVYCNGKHYFASC